MDEFEVLINQNNDEDYFKCNALFIDNSFIYIPNNICIVIYDIASYEYINNTTMNYKILKIITSAYNKL